MLQPSCCRDSDCLMPISAALERLTAAVPAVVESETIALLAADGRILAEDVTAPFDLPPKANSAVDGYAVRFADLAPGLETVLPVGGRVAAGHPLGRAVRAGEAVRIFTGAALPDGADTVVMQEDCRVQGGAVVLPPLDSPGGHCRAAGEDVAAGTVCLRAGQRLRPQELALAASLGRTQLKVRRPLRVAVFSTGDEIREPGTELGEGCIYDANRFILGGLLGRLGCVVTDLGILPDDEGVIRGILEQAAGGHDMIVTSGGMSVGEEDHVKGAVQALGELDFWRLNIKPGKPVAVGRVGAVPFVGLPGNPVAVMVTFLLIARPLILGMLGAEAAEPPRFAVRAGFDHVRKHGRRDFLRGRLVHAADGGLTVVKFPHEGSHMLSSLVEADGLIELPEDRGAVKAGELVDFLPFGEVM